MSLPDSNLVNKIYLSGFTPDNAPMTGKVECFMGDDVYLCKPDMGALSAGTPFNVNDMLEWRFFNNRNELNAFLQARQTLIENQQARLQQQEKDKTKSSRKSTTNTPRKSGNARRKSPSAGKSSVEDLI